MKHLFFILLLLIILVINSCKDDDSFENVTTKTQKTDTEETNEETVEDSYITGKIRVKFTEELALQIQTSVNSSKNSNTTKTKVKSVDNALSSLNVTNLKRTLPYCGKFEKRTHKEGLDRWYDITFDKSNSLTKANNDLSSIDGIDIVEYIPIVKISDNTKNTASPYTSTKNYSNIVTNEENDIYPFNDPGLKYQWHYYNDGTDYSLDPNSSINMVQGCDINVFSVWKNFTTGNKDVIVAVIDEGIEINHEDLAGNIWQNSSELNGTPGVDDDNNGYIDDINGYNFVQNTGNIVGGDHGTHIAGTIGAVNNNGIGVCGIAGGNKEKNIKGVSLMSCEIFEYYTDDNGNTNTLQGDAIEAIKYAADNGAVIAQCSWGYANPTSNYIEDYYKNVIDYFIKYAGIDENGIQTGPMKGGVIIFSAGNEANIYGPPGSYEHAISVASIGSDYKAAYYTNYGNWVDISAPGGDTKKGHKILSTITNNRYYLYQGTSMACPHVSGVAALIVSYFEGTDFTNGFTNDMLKERLLNSANDIIYDYNDSTYTNLLGSGLVDARAAFLYDSTNHPPVITSENKSHVIIHYHESTEIKFTISDPENNSITTSFNTGSTAADFSSENLTNSIKGTLSIAGNQAEEGTYNFVLTATDEYGANTTYTLEYTILPNNPPTTAGEIENIVFNGISGSSTITLTDYFTDIDGETLTYNIEESNSTITNTSISDGKLQITPLEYGNTKITVTASDAKNTSCSLTFKVLVRSDIKPIDVYPNPVSSSVTVRPGETIKDVTITFTNASGTQVKKINTDNIEPFSPVKINLSDLAAGVYSIKITSSGNERFLSSIIKL